MRSRCLHLIVSALCCVGSSVAQDDVAAKTREYLQRCERFGFAGSVLVAKGGKVLLAEGFGLADREAKVRNTRATLFEIASATKPFTAVAILQLEAAGKLATSDPIEKHLPGVPEAQRGITIQHLLTHTSGMSRMAAGGGGDDLERAVADYLATPRVRKPGEGHEYWNGGYALLAGIVERASGGTFMDWCRQHVLAPAKMTSSGFTGDRLQEEQVAIGYEGDAAPRRATEHPYGSYGWQYRGMGGLVTSVDDFYRFDRALADDTLLAAAARKKLFTVARDHYACGFYVLDDPRRRICHGGDVRGFHTQFSRFPDDDGCIVILCNVGGVPTWTIEENLRALVFGDKSRYPQPPATEVWSAEQLRALTGVYELADDERIHVRVADAGFELIAEGVQTSRRLKLASFGRPEEPAAQLVTDAKRIVEGVVKGDVEPLREKMNEGIPPRWPDDVKKLYWPAHTARWGPTERVRVIGALAEHGTTTVLLALEHAQGSSRVKVVFARDRLQIFDLDGPQALVSCIALPAQDRLVRFAWLGAPPEPIVIERNAERRITGLSCKDVLYRRVSR